MALYIVIEKQQETNISATYKFWEVTNENDRGVLEINKLTGEITLPVPMQHDKYNIISSRAARKISLHWRNNEYPSITQWAS